jgi:hypothetical protein
VTPATDGASAFTPSTIERAVFDSLVAAPDAVRVTFRSIGHVPIVVLLLALSLAGYLADDRRVTFDCRRDTGACVLTEDGPWHHERAEFSLGEVQHCQVAEVGSRDRSERTVELVRDSGVLRFGPAEPCRPSSDCPETAGVARQIQQFLELRAEPALHVSYGPFSSPAAAIVVSLLALLFGLVQLERVVVVVSSKRRQLAFMDHHALGRRRYHCFPLDMIATCVMDSLRAGRHGRSFVSLVSPTGKTYQLTRSGPLQGWLRERFVNQVNQALIETHH